jgi:hypothetical protein
VESRAPLPFFPWPLGGKGGGFESKMGGLGGGDLGSGRGLQWMYGLGPCTTPSLGYPPKILLKLDDFSISFGDFIIFL